MKRLVRLAAVAAVALAPAGDVRPQAAGAPRLDPEGWRLAVPPWVFAFPRDHASHPAFRTEWWYYTGHLADPASGRSYGFQLTFFRAGLSRAWEGSRSRWAPRDAILAHFAITDPGARRFRYAERAGRAALGMAGADTARYRVWIDGWRAELDPEGRHRLEARDGAMAIALELEPRKAPVVHGEAGVSAKAAGVGHASHYYSLTRLDARGTLELEGRVLRVIGSAWMDHEFGSDPPSPEQAGWDWFSLQLDDGRELMLYLLRRRDGSIEPRSSGTLVGPDGASRHLALDAFAVRVTGRWRNRAGDSYPARWTVSVPGEGLELGLEPRLDDQELDTAASTGVTYWEGAVSVTGTARGRPVTGRGYVELTGYSGSSPGF